MLVTSNVVYASGENTGINYFSYFGSLIFFLIIFAGVVFLALYTTKFIAKKTNNLGRGKNLNILEIINLNGQVKIVTVKIYKKIYILSISNNHTSVIDKLDPEDLDLDFEDYLSQNMMNNQKDLTEYVDDLKKLKDKIFKK